MNGKEKKKKDYLKWMFSNSNEEIVYIPLNINLHIIIIFMDMHAFIYVINHILLNEDRITF